MRLVETATKTAAGTIPGGSGSFPVVNYDQLTVDEISSELGNFSTVELETVRGYEKRNENHDTLIE
jgi:hypothetical protein